MPRAPNLLGLGRDGAPRYHNLTWHASSETRDREDREETPTPEDRTRRGREATPEPEDHSQDNKRKSASMGRRATVNPQDKGSEHSMWGKWSSENQETENKGLEVPSTKRSKSYSPQRGSTSEESGGKRHVSSGEVEYTEYQHPPVRLQTFTHPGFHTISTGDTERFMGSHSISMAPSKPTDSNKASEEAAKNTSTAVVLYKPPSTEASQPSSKTTSSPSPKPSAFKTALAAVNSQPAIRVVQPSPVEVTAQGRGQTSQGHVRRDSGVAATGTQSSSQPQRNVNVIPFTYTAPDAGNKDSKSFTQQSSQPQPQQDGNANPFAHMAAGAQNNNSGPFAQQSSQPQPQHGGFPDPFAQMAANAQPASEPQQSHNPSPFAHEVQRPQTYNTTPFAYMHPGAQNDNPNPFAHMVQGTQDNNFRPFAHLVPPEQAAAPNLFAHMAPAAEPGLNNITDNLHSGSSTTTTTTSSNPFGAPTQTAQPASNLFGSLGSTTTSQPQQTSGLFGSTPAAGTQQNQTPGLGASFGSSLLNPSSQPSQTPSLSGSTLLGSNTGQQQQQTSNPFGGTLGQPQQQQQQPQQQTSSLFGGTLGAPQQQQQQPQGQAPSLFGGSTLQNPAPSLFGQSISQQQQQPQGQGFMPSSLAGAVNTNSLPTLALGQSTATQNQATSTTVPGVKIDLSQIRGTTRFGDLHEDIQKQLEEIDKFIQLQISQHEQVAQFLPQQSVSVASIPPDVELLSSRLETVELALDNDGRSIAGLKETIKADGEDAKRAFRGIENLKLPQQFHYAGVWGSQYVHQHQQSGLSKNGSDAANDAVKSTDLIGYFDTKTAEMKTRIEGFERNLQEVSEHLRLLDQSMLVKRRELASMKGRQQGEQGKNENIRELANVLREFENGLLHVAGNVGGCRETVQQLQLGNGAVNGHSSTSSPVRNGAGSFGRR